MAKKFLGTAPIDLNDLARLAEIDSSVYPFTTDEDPPVPTRFGHWWFKPSVQTLYVWAPDEGGNGDWFPTGSGGGTGPGTDSFALLARTDGGVPQFLSAPNMWATTTSPEKLILDGGNF